MIDVGVILLFCPFPSTSGDNYFSRHLHDDYGAVILWGTDTHLEDFVSQCQIVTNLQGDTFGNLSFLMF